MAEKVHTSCTNNSWNLYWNDRSLKDEISTCNIEGLLPIFMKFLPRDGTILEAGCGLAKWVVYLRNEGFSIYGCDTNELCISLVKKQSPGTPILLSDIKNLSFKDQVLDAYISLGVLEHFEEGPDNALKEAHRVLKNNGLAFIEVPYLNGIRTFIFPFKKMFRLLRRALRMEPKEYYFSEYRYSKKELESFVKSSGFKIVFTGPKDLNSPTQNIGLWLDFPFLRNKKQSASPKELNAFGVIISKILRSISPWLSCGLVICIGKKSVAN